MPPPNKRKSQLNDALGRPKSLSCQTEFDKFQELLEVTRAELLATKEMNESLQQQMDELKNARNELQVCLIWILQNVLWNNIEWSISPSSPLLCFIFLYREESEPLKFDYSKFAYFQVVDELSPIIIGMAQEDLVNMNAWCKKTFKKNGLLEKIQNSQITTAEAEEKVSTKHT